MFGALRLSGLTRLALLTAATVLALSSPGHALRFVARDGADTNPCSQTQPCRTLQHAVDLATPGDEVHVLDSGGYGTLNITKSVSIIANGVDAIVPGSITINDPTAIVTLQGLHLAGAGTASTGITISDAVAVHIRNCTIERYTSSGILLNFADAELFIIDTVVRDNGVDGLGVNGTGTTAKLIVENSRFENNGEDGMDVDGIQTSISRSITSGNGGDGVEQNGGQMNITDTTAANNLSAGFRVATGSAQMTLQSVVGRGNSSAGFAVGSSTIGRVASSVFSNNTIGIQNSGGTVLSLKNNLVSGNTTNVSGAVTTLSGV